MTPGKKPRVEVQPGPGAREEQYSISQVRRGLVNLLKRDGRSHYGDFISLAVLSLDGCLARARSGCWVILSGAHPGALGEAGASGS